MVWFPMQTEKAKAQKPQQIKPNHFDDSDWFFSLSQTTYTPNCNEWSVKIEITCMELEESSDQLLKNENPA